MIRAQQQLGHTIDGRLPDTKFLLPGPITRVDGWVERGSIDATLTEGYPDQIKVEARR